MYFVKVHQDFDIFKMIILIDYYSINNIIFSAKTKNFCKIELLTASPSKMIFIR